MKALPQLSLTQKLIVLVTLPLAVQFTLMLGLIKTQNDAEKQLSEANRARNISDSVNHLNNDVYEIIAAYGDERSVEDFSPDDKTFLEYRHRYDKDFADLRQLARSQPELISSIDEAEKAGNQALADLIEIKENVIKYGSHFRIERRPLWVKLREHTMKAIESELFTIGEKESRLANQAPEIQAKLRHDQLNLMIAAAVAGILVAIVMAIVLSKSISQRLARMYENTFRLASGEALMPVMGGSDEISKLDQVFHSMAASLEGAKRKESAFIDSANDVLCMIAPGGRITFINPSCEYQFGFQASDLTGSHFIDLVVPTEQSKANAYFDKLQQGQTLSSLDLQMRRVDRTIADTILSAQWSADENSFFCIIHDISAIREAERSKQEVLAMVTHDLKTPLTTIANALEILPQSTPEKQKHYFEMTRRNVQHMKNLVADMLDIEKAKAGMLKLGKEQIQLSEVFDAAIDTTTGMADVAKVEITYQDPELTVNLDPESITRVLINLISNAVKFSPAGGKVVIAADKTDNWVQVSVQDQGPGIPAKDLERVFERFQQSTHSSAHANAGGTGLGLAICREFVRLHGGKIWVESTEGQGSKFVFTLPA